MMLNLSSLKVCGVHGQQLSSFDLAPEPACLIEESGNDNNELLYCRQLAVVSDSPQVLLLGPCAGR